MVFVENVVVRGEREGGEFDVLAGFVVAVGGGLWGLGDLGTIFLLLDEVFVEPFCEFFDGSWVVAFDRDDSTAVGAVGWAGGTGLFVLIGRRYTSEEFDLVGIWEGTENFFYALGTAIGL
jgi:hypothetical protein